MSNSEINKSKEDLIKKIAELHSEIAQLKESNINSKVNNEIDPANYKKNKNLFLSIFEDSGIGMAIINKNYKIIKFNKVFSEELGYSKDEIYNMTYYDLLPDENKENASRFLKDMFSSKQLRYESEQVYIKKDKTLLWNKLTATVIHDEFGLPEYIIGMGENITEQINSRQKLKEAKEKAEESDKLKTAFLTNMSHEIRTPMNAIIGFSELITDPNTDLATKKEFTELIYSSSNMLLKLIDDIIDISQIDAGNLKISNKRVNVSNVLSEFLDKIQNEKKEELKEDIEILLHNPFGNYTAYIETDELRFIQIFEHLLNNALKYTHKGFIEFGFDIDQQNKPTFYVRDTGIGIPEDKKEFIFKPFTKIEDIAKLYRGIGIGLTITQKLVKLLGGKLWVESNPGIGSIFYFTLPNKIKLLEIPRSTKNNFPNYNWNGKHILIAEDEDTNYAVLKASLSKTYANLTRVTQGDQAVEYCKENNYDIVLMDIRMPVLNGIDAAKQIKLFKPNLPIIAQTAFVLKNERNTCLNAGCNEYIPKPTKSSLLLEMISKFID